MKKILVILSLVGFVAVNVSAQTPQATTETKKETTVSKSDAKPAMKACCSHGSAMKNCSAEQAKNCTPAQKAECAKAGTAKASGCDHGDKVKAAAAVTEEKKEGTKANNN